MKKSRSDKYLTEFLNHCHHHALFPIFITLIVNYRTEPRGDQCMRLRTSITIKSNFSKLVSDDPWVIMWPFIKCKVMFHRKN